MTGETTSHGVEDLIARLRADGVEAGRAEAERLVTDAKADAARILDAARAEAETFLAHAKRDADAYVQAGQKALETASRDAVLSMKSGIAKRFREDVERLVSTHAADPEIIKKMILEVVGKARAAAGDGPAEVILPADALSPDDIRANPADVQSGQATEFVLGLTGQMLRDGISMRAADDLSGGIRVRLDGNDVELDLSDDAIAALLMEHLQPRFRAVMEGVIRGKRG